MISKNMEEIWKDIEGYEGSYQVSNLGRVRSVDRKRMGRHGYKTRRGIILKPFLRRDGYYEVKLFKKHFKIHQLVIRAFIPNPNNYPCVNHKDENKLNNFIFVNNDGTINESKSNLEWCTYSYNVLYGTGRQRRIDKYKKYGIGKIAAHKALKTRIRKGSKLAPISVNQFSLDGKFIKRYNSIKEASIYTNSDQALISKCYKGERASANGYVWVGDDDLERGRAGTKIINYRGKRVLQYDLCGNLIQKWWSAVEASEFLGFKPKGINIAASGINKTYKGFVWKYANKKD